MSDQHRFAHSDRAMPPLLFHCPAMRDLAKRIAETGSVELGAIDWRRFEDSSPDIVIRGGRERIKGRDVALLASFATADDIFRQLAVAYAIPRYSARSFTFVLPYFLMGTNERVDVPGRVVTAKTLARMLSAIPGCHGSGPARILTYDIHALPEQFFFGDDVVPDLVSAIPLLRRQLETFKPEDKIAIAFPDDGAYKRFGKMFPDYPQIICRKNRQGDRRTVSIVDGNPRGRHVVIVDDLVKTGGTLLECAAAVRRGRAKHVSASVTHAVFPKQSWRRFIKAGFEYFWITDSCPQTVRAITDRGPFENLTLAGSIAAELNGG